jgi:hypothetical protein
MYPSVVKTGMNFIDDAMYLCGNAAQYFGEIWYKSLIKCSSTTPTVRLTVQAASDK